MPNQNKTFAIGDRVWWESQANGGWVRKEGVIVEVVIQGNYPINANQPSGGVGLSRDHDSYIVVVDSITRHSVTKTIKPKPYWPRVSALRLCEGDER